MNCSYGPYKITSSLEALDEFTFIESKLPRRIAVSSNCAEIVSPPCSDAMVLHIEEDCPDGCKIFWYECPSQMGRQYTILPTPCSVRITSFEDGLVVVDNCDATLFGSDLFCFGKIYTDHGIFDSPDKSLTTFVFDGHTFTVKGESGDCGELYDCPDCQAIQSVMAFADLPTPPEDISAPQPEGVILDDPFETEIIPGEERVQWHWDAPTSPFGQDTLCEDEKPLTSWPGGTSLPTCASNDNPSIATLPSGHTVVAYENRREDGLTKITVAVLSSSVRENIRSHRKLGTGTLLNNLVESEGVATFIVYEEISIPTGENDRPVSNEKIGFTTGPFAGNLFTITKLTRILDKNIVRNEFKFSASGGVFPDKNHIYDVSWFIVDDRGSADLPSSENITTILDLPYHRDGEGNAVPVSNPSIAVAQNNQMVSNEQNIYVAYQAFVDNQWRVYLREIILGTDEPVAPAYISPYLFNEDVRHVEIMALPGAGAPIVPVVFYDESFSGAGLNKGDPIDTTGRWSSLDDTNIPEWRHFSFRINTTVPYETELLKLCDAQGPEGATGLPLTGCTGEGGSVCSVVYNSLECLDVGVDDRDQLFHHTRSFAVNTTETLIDGSTVLDLSFKMRFHIVLNDTDDENQGPSFFEYPEFWFLIGKSTLTSAFSDGYRIQIRRGKTLSTDSMETRTSIWGCNDKCSRNSNCFIFSLYKETSPRIDQVRDWDDRDTGDGSQNDLPTRVIWKCIADADIGTAGDYSFVDWNEWRIDTYFRGAYRFFELYLTHPDGTEILMATFREWEDQGSLGGYHGFGLAQSFGDRRENYAYHQVLIDSFSSESIPRVSTDRVYFFEDFLDRDDRMLEFRRRIIRASPFMKDEGIAQNFDYNSSRIFYCGTLRGDMFYGLDNVETGFQDQSIMLGGACDQETRPAPGRAAYLRILPDAIGGTISMVISVNRNWREHEGAWPHVWFVGRLFSNDLNEDESEWFDRYRLRISRFTCVSDYPGVGPGLSTGDKVWRFSAYNSGTGSNTDTPASEAFLIIGTDTNLDWIEYATTGGGPPGEDTVWNYFRIDMYDDAGQVVFDIYIGDDRTAEGEENVEVHPDDIVFTLLHSLRIDPIGTGTDGPFFGIALFTGADDESAEGLSSGGNGDSYLSSAHVNYVALYSTRESVIGACCRAVGGCDDNIENADCQSPDIWNIEQTCQDIDCSVDFPIGAGCTEDGICHDNITEQEAINQGIGLCNGCEWQAGKDCNGGGNDRNCPEILTGRCCRPQAVGNPLKPACVDHIFFSSCEDYYGETPIPGGEWIPGLQCNEEPRCVLHDNGRCCLPGGCHITTAESCEARGGDFLLHEDCISRRCPTDGACCAGTSCTQENEVDCDAAGSVFLGIGVSCSPNPCLDPDPIGACCFNDGACADIIEAACIGGTWFYGSLCEDSPCPPGTGACCDPFTGECEDDITLDDCQNSGRTFFGEGSICSYVNCDQPTGSCCVNSDCFDSKTLEECTGLGGNYQGDFSNCIENICAGEDPYLEISINYKPEDLWIIETASNEYITRVLYHMQEEIIVSSVQPGQGTNSNNTIDFMFLVDHSGSMNAKISKLANAIPDFATKMASTGLDVRFGFTMFGRGSNAFPNPPISSVCDCAGIAPPTDLNANTNTDIIDGLQTVTRCQSGNPDRLEGATNGFTRNSEYLQRAMFCWGVKNGQTSPWSAIQFALEDSQFSWRENATKFVLFVTDTHSREDCVDCSPWSRSQTDATNALLNAKAIMIPAVNLDINNDDYLAVSEASGWSSGLFDINSSDYSSMFDQIINTIDTVLRIDHATVIERAASGTDQTYLKKGEVIISYGGDLSDLWTFNKSDFEFSDKHVPFPGTNVKQLVNFPFPLASGKVYGIDSVHIQGNPNNWVSFGEEGPLIYSHPDVGHRASGVSETPVLISTNSTRPKVYLNNRNQVMVAYENYTTGTAQIEIRGTGDFHQNSITGPRANRIVRLLNQNDFTYRHTITLPGEGVNQLCDFIIDNSDITHVVWQSSRDGYWEIYYGNSFNMFDPVRITKADSRSSHPSIDVDETGSIFVVYHDNRFGPFNIMLSSKDEERVIPLLEQDAYLASLRTGYEHYTNTIPLLLDNPSGEIAVLDGIFWASKKEDGAGNDSENFIYQIDETTGVPSKGFDLGSSGQEAIAFSSNFAWGIASDGVLTRLGTIGDGDSVTFSPSTIGSIELNISGFNSATILDMAVDKFDRIWVLIYEIANGGNDRLRLEYVSGISAVTVARGIVKENNIDSSIGGSLAISSNNLFFMTWSNSASVILSSSEYPEISNGIATFVFLDINSISSFIPVSMTSGVSNVLYAVSSDNDLYIINNSTGDTTFQASLTSGSGDESLSVGTTSGIAHQTIFLAQPINTGSGEFFHIRIDFYSNILFEGDPFLSIDSRENLEAFINDETINDPYVALGMDARGIFLEPNEVGIVFFDATNFVPGFSRLAQPFSFEPNQTYFPRVFLISANESVRESGLSQSNSFSCTKCSRFGNNNFNSSSCSYSFVIPNNESDTQSFNFQIDFYADTGKQHLIRRFEAIPGSEDLQYMEVDNKPAVDQWDEFGLTIIAGDSAFIQIHPVLDPTAGFLCGVTYAVQVNECHSSGESCSGFSKTDSSDWIFSPVGTIVDQISGDEVMLGLSMKLIGNKLSIAWRTPEGFLKFAQLNDDLTWTSQVVLSNGIIYCDLAEINGLPSISYVSFINGNSTGGVLTLKEGSWESWPIMDVFESGTLINPRILLEYNNAPLVVFADNGIPYVLINDGQGRKSFQFGGSADPSSLALASINDELPAVCWKANTTRYCQWFASVENFSDECFVFFGNHLGGKRALSNINGQPAFAHVVISGGGAEIQYQRQRDDDSGIWDITLTGVIHSSFSNNLAMTEINGQPHIAYSVKTSSTTSQLRYTFFNGTRFVDSLVADNLNEVDHLVGIVNYNNAPVITISANPLRVYFPRVQQDNSPSFFCECSSKIFTNRLTHLNEVARWESSAHGFVDTSVTDSQKNSLRPVIKTRKTLAAIVIWEDHNKSNNCSDPPCIRAATFRNVNQDQLRGSGTKSWFDYDFGIKGQDADLSLDIFERVNSIYEKPKIPSLEGFHGRHLSRNELPGNELYGKVCDFAIAEATEASRDCDISALENNVISFDQFISSQIVRKIRVKDEFVQYYTYNASGVLTPIVSICNISLEIHGTPEIVALRFRNENETIWGAWCPWSPQISDFVIEKEHRISSGSGIKEICIQAMTYAGITTDICLPIIADYETVVFETRFYKNTDSEGNEIINFNTVDSDGFFPVDLDAMLVDLPLSNGISVAGLDIKGGGTECSGDSECGEDEICLGGRCVAKTAKILVEIIPNEFSEEIVNFDVIQQGTNDQRGRVSNKGKNNDGRVLYRGEFTIEREDNVSNTDGLARVNPTFPGECTNTEATGASSTYTRDVFNEMVEDTTVEEEDTDPLANFRQATSGRIGVSLDVRSSEDPYFVFGDPDYSLRKTDGQRLGVPFQIVETDITTGRNVDQDGGFCDEPPGGCPEDSTWQPWPICKCSPPSG